MTADQTPISEVDARVGQIAEEFMERLSRGDSPTVEEYAAAEPDLADVLRGVLPLVLAAHTSRVDCIATGMEAQVPPERLGEFRIVREVGRGGMGIVYEAVQEPLGRRVALKVLPAAVQLHPAYSERFRREAQAAARLHHTNIVPVFGVGEADGVRYYAMQFIDGTGLDSLSRQKRNDPLAVARWGLQAAEGLAYAHAHGVLHRDVKPANLLLDSAGTIWVTDFGLAKLADAADLTASGDFIGTLRYTAPECLGGQADARSDVYSLGATLYELLTGRPPFDAVERDRLVRQIAEQEPPRPRKLNPEIPRDLETVVLRSLAKEPQKRYATASELADDLRRFLDGRPVAARRASPVEHVWRWCRRRPAVAGLLALSTAALVALLVVSLVANARLNKTLERVGEERDRAEANAIAAREARDAAVRNLRRARDAVDRMLANVGAVRLAGVPLVEKVRRDLLEDALKFSEEFLREAPADPELRWEAATAYLRVGLLRNILGAHGPAEEANRKGIALLSALRAEFPDAPEYERDLAKQLNNLGGQLRTAGRLPEALAAFRQAVALHERLATVYPNQPNYRLDLAKHHSNLGVVYHALSRVKESEEAFRRAIELSEGLRAADSRDKRYRYELAYALDGLGTVLGAAGKMDKAEEALKAAVDLLGPLVDEDPRTPLYRKAHVRANSTLGHLYRNTRRPDAAADAIRAAIRTAEQLAAEYPATEAYRIELGRAYASLAALLTDRRRWSDAESAFKRAIDIHARLAADFPTAPHHRQSLSNNQVDLGLLYEATGRPSEASAIIGEGLAIKEKLAADFPTVAAYQGELGAALNNQSQLLRDRGELAEARRLAERAIVAQRAALKMQPTSPRYQGYLANHWYALGRVLLKQDEIAAAARAATDMAAAARGSGQNAFFAACLAANCGKAAAKDERVPVEDRPGRAAAYDDQAMELLREAVRRGWRDVKQLETAPELERLRGREDFRKLIADLRAGPAGG